VPQIEFGYVAIGGRYGRYETKALLQQAEKKLRLALRLTREEGTTTVCTARSDDLRAFMNEAP
jgi:hypothetical protein